MRRNTICIVALVSALLAGPLGSCTASPDHLPPLPPTVLPTPAPSATSPSLDLVDPTGCEVHLWHALTGPQEAALLELATAFEQANEQGLRVRVEFHSPLESEVWAAAAAGTPPDIVMAPCYQVLELAATDMVVPLQDYVSSTQHGLSKPDLADLWPMVLECGCLASHGGQPLGLLLDSHMVVMFYDRAWLKRLKVTAPPQDWEQFREICGAAQDTKAGTWGLVWAEDGSTVASWILGLGGQLVDQETGVVNLASPEAVAVLSVLHDLVQDGCAYCVEDLDGARAAFASGQALFTFGSTADLAEYLSIAAEVNGFDPGLAPVPYRTEQPVASVQGTVASILRTEPRQQLAAWVFLQWLMRIENDAHWVLATGSLPKRKSTLDVVEIQAHLEQNPMYREACALLADARPEPVAPDWDAILPLLARAARDMCEEQADAAAALAVADMALDVLADR
jgi:ABC-type glycerol-3-phosphate transport system substrate-binding protein